MKKPLLPTSISSFPIVVATASTWASIVVSHDVINCDTKGWVAKGEKDLLSTASDPFRMVSCDELREYA